MLLFTYFEIFVQFFGINLKLDFSALCAGRKIHSYRFLFLFLIFGFSKNNVQKRQFLPKRSKTINSVLTANICGSGFFCFDNNFINILTAWLLWHKIKFSKITMHSLNVNIINEIS